jgi:hypothetical protein
LPAGLSGLDRAGGRDVVGGDRIAEDRQRRAPTMSVDRLGVIDMPVEVGRVLDVGRLRSQA